MKFHVTCGGGVDYSILFSVHFQYFYLKRHCETKLSPGGGVSKMSVIPFCIDFCAFSTLLCENPPKVHFVSEPTGALSPGGGVKIVNFSILY